MCYMSPKLVFKRFSKYNSYLALEIPQLLMYIDFNAIQIAHMSILVSSKKPPLTR